MKVIADLQLHSKYSRAVSERMTIDEIWRWSMKKGIGLVATGDWTHPLWMREIKTKLVERGDGILEIRKEYKRENGQELSRPDGGVDPLFLLATEVSSIYTAGGKARRIHNLIWSPSLEVADAIIAEFLKRGCNLGSDGRPIIGLSSQEVAELVFGVDERCMLVPAHAWTPWFSLYGSKSGFDSVEECFGKYADRIHAVETGLSSDPVMNWEIADLDSRAIVSFSDAHSGPKLGREATVFELESLTFNNIVDAIKNGGLSPRKVVRNQLPVVGKNHTKKSSENRIPKTENRIACTFEFYPEEGKYHYDGHRTCNVRYTPEETRKKGIQCPVCGRPLTVGVMYRVEELSKRKITPIFTQDALGVRWVFHPEKKRPPFVNLVPLPEILAEALGTAAVTPKTFEEYHKLILPFGGEFNVLLKTDRKDIEKVSGAKIADAISRVRSGNIFIDPGYDGVFGKVKVWSEKGYEPVVQDEKKQLGLF